MKNKSFTLIELLVVIVIIGILAGVIIVSVSSSIDKAKFAKAQAFSNTVQNELLSDLISEWTFDEDSGTTAKDTWGNNDGTVYGATYKTKADGVCVYGGCYSFNGTNDYIVGSIRLAQKEVTVSVWVKPNNLSGSKAIICKNGPFILKLINDKFGSNTIIYAGGTWVALSGIKSLTANWNYLVMTYGSGYVKTYVNGEYDTSVVKTGDLVGNGSFIVGAASTGGALPTGGFFGGLIDDVRVYGTDLSSSQIKQQYVAGLDSLLSKKIISKEDYNEKINQLAQE